ncbi:SDR family oxidoreductase [Aestuariivirga sp.]|uniref:SDR family oxidoreductase n=1 Tax=Aestuariivirga sp. TaxID=2650926 RepID=UPI0039E24D3A
MQMTGNTILITGGSSGIGRALAEAFHAHGNQVIITGRRKALLNEVSAAHPGITAMELDVEDPKAIAAFAREVTARFPKLNVLINNAGIMRHELLTSDQVDVSIAEATVATNLLGPMRLSAALLPHLKAQPQATIITVSSGLAFVPRADYPAYCATKAAIHSWSQSLRFQLRNTSVRVLELAPPYVQTELTGAHQLTDERAMPLGAFITEVMTLLEQPPANGEILVQRVYPQRFAEASGKYDEFFAAYHARVVKS